MSAADSPAGDLADRRCTRIRKGTPPLAAADAASLLARIPGWTAPGGARLEREFRFPDFKTALAFVDRVGALAEAEDHHPDIALAWGRVGVTLSTHSAKGLTENDFILAAKISKAFGG